MQFKKSSLKSLALILSAGVAPAAYAAYCHCTWGPESGANTPIGMIDVECPTTGSDPKCGFITYPNPPRIDFACTTTDAIGPIGSSGELPYIPDPVECELVD